jgi:hypothetical protein
MNIRLGIYEIFSRIVPGVLYYDGIYQTILAYRIDLETAIKPVRSHEKRSKAEKEA